MKKYITSIVLIVSTSMFAQVGIGTETPTRLLDINGNLRVANLQDKTNSADYTYVLAADDDNNIDKVSIPAIIEDATKQVQIVKNIYNATTTDNTRIVQCGKLSFRLENSKIYMKLNNEPTSAISFVYGSKRWGAISASTTTGYSYSNLTLNFSTADWNTYKNIDTTFSLREGAFVNYHFIVPGDGDMYRITASQLKNDDKTSNYSLICERFYKTEE